MTYTCPVCDYAKLKGPASDFNICPCCGTEFGNDDDERSHAELRDEWIAKGRTWFSRFTKDDRDSPTEGLSRK